VLPCAGIEVGIGRGLGGARDAEQRAEGVERVETPIEAERELVEVGLEMLRAHAMVDAVLNLYATTRIGGCRMPASLLEILRSIPDHRRAEGDGVALLDLGVVAWGWSPAPTPTGKCMNSFAFISRNCMFRNLVLKWIHG
jgi:hypothetical protein